MNYSQTRILLKKAALCLAMPLALLASSARAEPTTYYFWTQSAYTYIASGGGYVQTPLTGSDLNLARSTFAESLQVTLLGTEGSLRYDYAYPEADLLDQSNLLLSGVPWRWGLGSFDPPVCEIAFCDITMSFQVDGGGLSGYMDIGHYDIQSSNLFLSGTGNSWSGWWGWDFNGEGFSEFHPTFFVTGRWKEVPLPTSIALVVLGLAGLGFARRRKH